MNNKDFIIATEIANAGTALVRNIAINKATEIILQRNFALNYSSTQATNEQNAIIEGNENNALNLFGLPLFDTVIFSYGATNQSYTFNIALLEVQQTKNIVT